jgi:hypothetical protein
LTLRRDSLILRPKLKIVLPYGVGITDFPKQGSAGGSNQV